MWNEYIDHTVNACTYINLQCCIYVAFTQPATGPSSVCKGSDVTLQCRIVFINDNDEANEQDSIWTRNGTRVVATTPNHRLMMNSTTGRITNLIITNVTLADDNSVYNCTDNGATIASFVVLNVTGTFNFYPYM